VQLFRKIDSRALLVLAALIAGPSAAYAQTDAAHLYFIDQPRADRDVARFLLRHSAALPAADLAVA